MKLKKAPGHVLEWSLGLDKSTLRKPLKPECLRIRQTGSSVFTESDLIERSAP